MFHVVDCYFLVFYNFSTTCHKVTFFSIYNMSSTTYLSMCDIFRSSTCHMIVHCFPLIILVAIHQLYRLSMNPHSCSISDSSFQNSSATCCVPSRSFFNCTCNIRLPCLLYHIYFLFIVRSSFMIISANVPLRSMCELSSLMSTCKNVPSMMATQHIDFH